MNPDPEGRAARLQGLRSDRAGAAGRAQVETMLLAQFGSSDAWTLTLPSDSVALRGKVSESYQAGRSSPGYFRTEFSDLSDCLTSAVSYLQRSPAESRWLVRFEESAILGLLSMTAEMLQDALAQLVEFDHEAIMLIAEDFKRGCLIDCSESFDSWTYTLEIWNV